MEQQCDAIFEEIIGEDVAGQLDFPVRKYLVNIMEAQTNLDTSTTEDDVIKTIGLFLNNCGCRRGLEASEQAVGDLIQRMKELDLIPKAPESVTRLHAPVQVYACIILMCLSSCLFSCVMHRFALIFYQPYIMHHDTCNMNICFRKNGCAVAFSHAERRRLGLSVAAPTPFMIWCVLDACMQT